MPKAAGLEIALIERVSLTSHLGRLQRRSRELIRDTANHR